jgi:hypothetical protein
MKRLAVTAAILVMVAEGVMSARRAATAVDPRRGGWTVAGIGGHQHNQVLI